MYEYLGIVAICAALVLFGLFPLPLMAAYFIRRNTVKKNELEKGKTHES
jgi:hypothetical protein